MTSEIAARIRNVRFKPVRIREGYAMDEVDEFLDRLESTAAHGQPLAPLFDALDLSVVSLREAYDIAEVDAFLTALRDGTPLPAEPEKKKGGFFGSFGRGG